MKEQSQIDDMRAALLGERERAEQARARSSENVRALLETDAVEAAVSLPEPPPKPGRVGLRGLFKRR